MAYKYASGSVRRGDIYFEDDTTGAATYIDFDQDAITFKPSGSAILYLEAGKVGIGTTSPDHTLHVKSPGTCHVKVESEAGYEAALKIKSGGQSSAYVWQPGSTSDLRFYINGADVMHLDNDGKVGIGTTTPDYTLDVAGNVGINEYIKHNGDSDTYIRFQADAISIWAGNEKMITCEEGGGGQQGDKVIINDSNQDIDFQVKGDNDANLIRTDAANDRVGISTDAPTEVLDIDGDAIRIRDSQTPASSVGADGDTQGMIAWDANYIYICTADWDGSADVWKRASISTW